MSGTEERVAEHAAEYGYTDVLKYLVEERELSDWGIEECVSKSVNYSQLECLKYLVEDAEAPLDDWELLAYARYSSEDKDIVDYLREKRVPRTNRRRMGGTSLDLGMTTFTPKR